MDPEWRCINPIETGDNPASYVSLPEGNLGKSRERSVCFTRSFRWRWRHSTWMMGFDRISGPKWHVPNGAWWTALGDVVNCGFNEQVIVVWQGPFWSPCWVTTSFLLKSLSRFEFHLPWSWKTFHLKNHHHPPISQWIHPGFCWAKKTLPNCEASWLGQLKSVGPPSTGNTDEPRKRPPSWSPGEGFFFAAAAAGEERWIHETNPGCLLRILKYWFIIIPK